MSQEQFQKCIFYIIGTLARWNFYQVGAWHEAVASYNKLCLTGSRNHERSSACNCRGYKQTVAALPGICILLFAAALKLKMYLAHFTLIKLYLVYIGQMINSYICLQALSCSSKNTLSWVNTCLYTDTNNPVLPWRNKTLWIFNDARGDIGEY